MTGNATLVSPSVWRVVHSRFESNTYICAQDNGGCFVVDPGLEADRVQTALDELSLVPTGVVCTHGHFDHIGSAADLQTRYGVKAFMHRADVPIAKTANFLLMACKVEKRITIPKFELVEGEEAHVQVGP